MVEFASLENKNPAKNSKNRSRAWVTRTGNAGVYNFTTECAFLRELANCKTQIKECKFQKVTVSSRSRTIRTGLPRWQVPTTAISCRITLVINGSGNEFVNYEAPGNTESRGLSCDKGPNL
jgi:hypothetical protein